MTTRHSRSLISIKAKNEPGETCRLAAVSEPGRWLWSSNCVRTDAQVVIGAQRQTGTRRALCQIRASTNLAPGLLQGRSERTVSVDLFSMCQPNGRGGAGVVLQITPWERDALQLLAAGVADDDIAAMLAISEGTVNSYLEDLFEKLGVTSRSEAVMAATRRGLVRVIECAEHRECLPLLTAEGETGRDAIKS